MRLSLPKRRGAAGAVSAHICALSNKLCYTGRPNSLRAEAIRATALGTSQFCIEVEAEVGVEVEVDTVRRPEAIRATALRTSQFCIEVEAEVESAPAARGSWGSFDTNRYFK